MKIYINKKEEKGYALLFTIVIVSIISIISMGLASTALKQMILSSLARDSTTAFYQADIGTECALYADVSVDADGNPLLSNNPSSFSCAGQTLAISPQPPQPQKYSWIISPQPTLSGPCFDISVVRTLSGTFGDTVRTQVLSNGYNICDKTNSRTVQRTIEVNY